MKMSRSGQDLKKFDWGLYDLVVIDESHNFRNRNDRYDDNDQLIMTRYARLMQDVIKHGNNGLSGNVICSLLSDKFLLFLLST